MGQTSSSRVLSRFTETDAPPEDTPLSIDYLKENANSLEEALKNVSSYFYGLDQRIKEAKAKFYNQNQYDLTCDEAAAIYLYTLEDLQYQGQPFYFHFNRDLRSQNRPRMKIWFPYLNLFMKALSKLPPERRLVYRCLRKDVSAKYTEGLTFVWTSATSCSRDRSRSKGFLAPDGSGTIFAIDASNGKYVAPFSVYQEEEEELLPPGSRFRVIKGPTIDKNFGEKCSVVHLREL